MPKRKQPPIMEWHVAESEADWAAIQARTAATPLPSSRRFGWTYWVMLVLAVGIGGWWWQTQAAEPALTTLPQPAPTIPWGAAQQLATDHFVFHFPARDAQAVALVAPRIERFYTTLQQNFGVTTTATAPLVITLTQTRTVATAPYRPRLFTTLAVPSPALYPVTTWSESDLLHQSLALLLIDHTLAHVVRQHGIAATRYPLLDGLRLWQLGQAELPLGRWQAELTHWVYVDLPTTAASAPLPLPQQYASFCAAYMLWMSHPAQIRLPLLCTGFDQAMDRLPRPLVQVAPRWLPPLDTPVYPDEEADAQGVTRPARHPGYTIVVATIVAHVSQRYGPAQVPRLVTAWGRYATWTELIPALYGVSRPAFEADWLAALDCATGAINNYQRLVDNC